MLYPAQRIRHLRQLVVGEIQSGPAEHDIALPLLDQGQGGLVHRNVVERAGVVGRLTHQLSGGYLLLEYEGLGTGTGQIVGQHAERLLFCDSHDSPPLVRLQG